VTSKLRQLRRVRWGVRLTLVLGISASLAANVLHARHLLIDQIISGWPPVAVFATIEAIARVPVRRRWLAVIRMAGLGFVAGIAFWVSYWHMASVAAAHGENGSKYLLPLSVDGLVVVSSISLVELTGQISAVEATARVATASAVAAPPPAAPLVESLPVEPSLAEQRAAPGVSASLAPVPELSTVPPQRHRPPGSGLAPVAVLPTVPPLVPPATVSGGRAGDAPVEPLAAAARQATPAPYDAPAPSTTDTAGYVAKPVVEPVVEPVTEPVGGPAGDPDGTGCRTDEVPPENPSEAIIWWRAKDPTLTLSQIAAKVGRSERTVRRTLDNASISAAPAEPTQPPSPQAPRRPANCAAVDGLIGSVVSSA
jgi:hypothetical protein